MIATMTSNLPTLTIGEHTDIIIGSELDGARGLARERRTIMRIEHRALTRQLATLDKHTHEYWDTRRAADDIEARLRKDTRKYRKLMAN